MISLVDIHRGRITIQPHHHINPVLGLNQFLDAVIRFAEVILIPWAEKGKME